MNIELSRKKLQRLAAFTTIFCLIVLWKRPFSRFKTRPEQDTERFSCDNIMNNLTEGRWIHWSKFVLNRSSQEYIELEKAETEFDDHMTKFRIRRGIHIKLWREDLKCGLKNIQTKPKGNAWGKGVGAWCNAKSNNPCCSDKENGLCGMICDCPKCIDMRKILHAEFARWIPQDQRCTWKNYTADEACKVIQGFSEIHIVGDSFIRKMARVMILMLRDNRYNGTVYKNYNSEMSKKCVSDDQIYWTECRFGGGTFKEMLADESPLCGMDLSRFVLHNDPNFQAGTTNLNLVKKLAGQPGTLILLGVGGHMNCVTKPTFDRVVQPSINYFNSFYKNKTLGPAMKRWPHIIYMFPDTPGVLKSPFYRPINGKVPCYKFTDEMKPLLSGVGISYLDFRKVTANIHSYDGTHHGIGVNVQKVQILLNYLNSLNWDNTP